MSVIEWLLDSDPAIRWQVQRDIVEAPADVVAAERDGEPEDRGERGPQIVRD